MNYYQSREAGGCTLVATPRYTHKLWSFLGFCTYYRRFVIGFADIIKPLTQLTKGKWTYQWSPEADTAVYSTCPRKPAAA